MFRALERKEPDMVPHFELGIDRKVMNKILPGASFEEFILHMDWDALMSIDRDFWEVEVLDESRRIFRDEWGTLKRREGPRELPAPQP